MSNTGWSRAAQDAAEAREVLYQSERLERFSATEERPRWLLTLSSVSICVAGGTALVLTWQTGGAILA
jgi:hypothetical protein